MKRLILVLIITGLLTSCKEEKTSRFPANKMQAILQDLHIAEAYNMTPKQDSLQRRVERNYDSLAASYQAIFKHHGTTQEEFNQNLEWYKHHPEELNNIYAKMADSMVLQQNNAQPPKP